MKIYHLPLLIILLARPVSSLAWGYEGHSIVAEIAFAYLPANIADSVKHYLGTMTIEEASNWMDEIRSDRSLSYMKSWHYIDLEKGVNYTDKSEPKNIMNQLERVIRELQHKSDYSQERISLDLKILFHLVGDLHQPLHCGYPEDKGGNTVRVMCMGKQENLHRVWDTEIIRYKHISSDLCRKDCNCSSQQLQNIGKIDPIAWFNQSRNLLSQVYAFEDNILTADYVEKNSHIIEKQLFDAGIRLSCVLIQVFSR